MDLDTCLKECIHFFMQIIVVGEGVGGKELKGLREMLRLIVCGVISHIFFHQIKLK